MQGAGLKPSALGKQADHYDIIILGAGIVGLAFANLCAQTNLSVALVEKTPPRVDWETNSFDVRVSAISRASQKLFTAIGVWEEIVRERLMPYEHMKVWDSLGYGSIEFSAQDVNEPDLGHIIENRVIVKALWEKLCSYGPVKRYVPAKPKSIIKEDEVILLELEDGQFLSAKLLVGADGAHSWLRRIENITTQEWDYQQKALVATVTTELPHEKTAWQRFLKNGPLAFLPLAEPNLCSIVWSTTHEQAEELLSLSDDAFCEELGYHFDYRLGKIKEAKDRVCFPLSLRHAKHYVKERIALVGDAAHVIHPFAGLGVNLGIMDAKELVEVLVKAHQNHHDIGNKLVLRPYERARRTQILGMMAALEGIKRIFDAKSSSMALIRSVGVNFVDHTPMLKNAFIRCALGL